MDKLSAYILIFFTFKRLKFSQENLDYKTHPHFLIRNMTLVSFIRRVL